MAWCLVQCLGVFLSYSAHKNSAEVVGLHIYRGSGLTHKRGNWHTEDHKIEVDIPAGRRDKQTSEKKKYCIGAVASNLFDLYGQ